MYPKWILKPDPTYTHYSVKDNDIFVTWVTGHFLATNKSKLNSLALKLITAQKRL